MNCAGGARRARPALQVGFFLALLRFRGTGESPPFDVPDPGLCSRRRIAPRRKKRSATYRWMLSLDEAKIGKLALPSNPGEPVLGRPADAISILVASICKLGT